MSKRFGFIWIPAFAGMTLGSVSACSGDTSAPTGNLTVLVEAEDVITDGIAAGTDAENIHDGWTVAFSKYIAVVGDIDLEFSTDQSIIEESPEAFAVDLTQVPMQGLTLWEMPGIRAGRWDFHYSTTGGADAAMRHSSVSEADFSRIVADDLTYLIEGTIMKAEGESCPPAALAMPGRRPTNGHMSGTNACYSQAMIRFEIPASAETVYGPCEIDGVGGVAVPVSGTANAAITLHGDHLFFNGFPEGTEGGVTRLAQWLADCDLNLDGVVTKAELEQIAPSALPQIDSRYQLGGSPIANLATMWDYVRAQLKTQGHLQGEGECPIDGAAHDHDH